MEKIDLSFLPGNYKASASISFDFETSAQSPPITCKGKFKTTLLREGNMLGILQRDLASRYGRGFANRKGAEKILELFQELNIHGTWFSTGHALLKGNRNRTDYQMNVPLPYATEEAGFSCSTTWRKNKKSFCHEPFSDYIHSPYYYLGDLTEKLYKAGEDIQCHSFSHPYMAMEPPENIKKDLEEWQKIAKINGFSQSTIFAFPFLGDVYYLSGEKKYIPFKAPDKSILVNLTPHQMKAFKSSGIELFARCLTSEMIEIFIGFKPYFNTAIYFMKDKGLMSFQDDKCFDEYLNMLISKGGTIDFWLHPNDVYDAESFGVFKKRIALLQQKYIEGELWLTTIKDQWERFKQIG